MPYSIWWLWVAFLFFLLLAPIGYGWGYRGWGAPMPRYVQRRRSQNAKIAGSNTAFDHQSWGWGGDVLWALMFVWAIWALFTWLSFGSPW